MKLIYIALLSLFLICFQFSLNAQIWQAPKIEIGASNRGTAYTLNDGREYRYFTVGNNYPLRFIGINEEPSNWVFLDIIQKLPGKNKLTIAFSNYLSLQKHWAIRKVVTNLSDAYTLKYKRDHFIDLYNSFGKKTNKIKPFLGIGVGFVNCGTSFKILPSGPLASISSPIFGTDRSTAFRFHAGLQMKALKTSIVTNIIGKENLGFSKLNIEAKFSYTIAPFAKGSQIFDLPKAKIFKTRLPLIDMGLALRTKAITLDSPLPFSQPLNGKLYPLQDATPRLFVDFKKKLFGRNNLYVELSNYITYTNIGGTQKLFKLKRDHFFDIVNHFKTKSETTQFLLGAGYGLMNCGTNYSYVQTSTDTLGQTIIVNKIAKSSQRFGTARLILGIQKNKYTGAIITHATPGEYGEQSHPTLWLEVKLGYTLSFNKKEKL